MTTTLDGKIALVTGGGSGIGRSTALAFAREGAVVAVVDRNGGDGQAVASEINATGGTASFIQADIAKSDQVQTMIGQILETYGRLDCAFNNAGIALPNFDVAEMPEDAWDRFIAVNLSGVFLCMKYEVQQMLRQGSGAIVNTSSIAGLAAMENPGYTAAKHGVIGLTKSGAYSYSKKGIRVNAICPGFIETPLVAPMVENNEKLRQGIIGLHPIGRAGQPMEVAEAVVWLCSDAASFVTGHAMAIDGGYLAM